MNKSDFIERLAAELEVSKKEAEHIYKTFLGIIISELKAGNEVTLTGFGTFSSRVRRARKGVNPQNPSEEIRIPDVRVAKFKAGKTLKDLLKAS